MSFISAVKWYKSYYEEDQKVLTSEDLSNYISDAKRKGFVWAI